MITIWVPKRLVEVDLYNVAARSPQALAQLSENSYARRCSSCTYDLANKKDFL